MITLLLDVDDDQGYDANDGVGGDYNLVIITYLCIWHAALPSDSSKRGKF